MIFYANFFPLHICWAVPSDSPKNLTVLEMSPSSVTLVWDAPPLVEQNGHLTGYSLNFSTSAYPWHSVSRVNESRATLSRLHPQEEVVVSVAAVNSNGTGPYTTPLALQTPANSECGIQVHFLRHCLVL